MVKMEDALKCRKCSSYIRFDTNYELICCACGAVGIEGGPDYVLIIGDMLDWEIVAIPVDSRG